VLQCVAVGLQCVILIGMRSLYASSVYASSVYASTRDHEPSCMSATSYCNTLLHAATHRPILHHTATHCTTLHYTAPQCVPADVWKDVGRAGGHKARSSRGHSKAYPLAHHLQHPTLRPLRARTRLWYPVWCSVLQCFAVCVAVRCSGIQKHTQQRTIKYIPPSASCTRARGMRAFGYLCTHTEFTEPL